jgi:hypothetical protein
MQNETIQKDAMLIEKELIPSLSFKKPISLPPIPGLKEKLTEATKLGNIHHVKVAIIFEDDEGLKRVETTIWASGGKYICLKGGIWLPTSRIHEIRFF